ncbi:MAG: CinA family protein [Aggregatilineales bacterium]
MMPETLEAQVGEALRARGRTVAVAESCTGGLVLHRLTNIPGSSAYVLGGVVAYANAIKQAVLKVKQGTLIAHGAVSAETALEMATGVRDLFKADYAVSITGIAGPGGGTAEKPVGLTYIALAGPDDRLETGRYLWDGNRAEIKAASAEAALALLLRAITEDSPPPAR